MSEQQIDTHGWAMLAAEARGVCFVVKNDLARVCPALRPAC
jgi:hypothetical protein